MNLIYQKKMQKFGQQISLTYKDRHGKFFLKHYNILDKGEF